MTPEEERRLWEFTLHEDGLFNERQSLFLVAESMLAVAYTTALVANNSAIALAIAVIALLITVMWMYVSARHARIVDLIQEKAKDTFPEYKKITAERHFRWMPIPSRTVVTFGVPPVIGALWVVLLVARL
jgi:hypothetical protein